MSTTTVTLQRTARDIVRLTGTAGVSIAYWCAWYDGDKLQPHDDKTVYTLDWERVPEIVFNPAGIKYVDSRNLARLRSCFIDDEDIIDPDGVTDDILIQLAAFGEIVYG